MRKYLFPTAWILKLLEEGMFNAMIFLMLGQLKQCVVVHILTSYFKEMAKRHSEIGSEYKHSRQ